MILLVVIVFCKKSHSDGYSGSDDGNGGADIDSEGSNVADGGDSDADGGDSGADGSVSGADGGGADGIDIIIVLNDPSKFKSVIVVVSC